MTKVVVAEARHAGRPAGPAPLVAEAVSIDRQAGGGAEHELARRRREPAHVRSPALRRQAWPEASECRPAGRRGRLMSVRRAAPLTAAGRPDELPERLRSCTIEGTPEEPPPDWWWAGTIISDDRPAER